MKKFLSVLLLTLIFCGCNSAEEKLVEEIIAENEYIIIDVRTEEEYDQEHIVGAINIPYDEIDEEIKLDKNKVIFVYCKSGGRSKMAFDELSNLGYTVYDLGAIAQIDLPKE